MKRNLYIIVTDPGYLFTDLENLFLDNADIMLRHSYISVTKKTFNNITVVRASKLKIAKDGIHYLTYEDNDKHILVPKNKSIDIISIFTKNKNIRSRHGYNIYAYNISYTPITDLNSIIENITLPDNKYDNTSRSLLFYGLLDLFTVRLKLLDADVKNNVIIFLETLIYLDQHTKDSNYLITQLLQILMGLIKDLHKAAEKLREWKYRYLNILLQQIYGILTGNYDKSLIYYLFDRGNLDLIYDNDLGLGGEINDSINKSTMDDLLDYNIYDIKKYIGGTQVQNNYCFSTISNKGEIIDKMSQDEMLSRIIIIYTAYILLVVKTDGRRLFTIRYDCSDVERRKDYDTSTDRDYTIYRVIDTLLGSEYARLYSQPNIPARPSITKLLTEVIKYITTKDWRLFNITNFAIIDKSYCKIKLLSSSYAHLDSIIDDAASRLNVELKSTIIDIELDI